MFEELISGFVKDTKENYIYLKELSGRDSVLKLFDEPFVGYAGANDELFLSYKEDGRITYGRFMPPAEWLPEAKTVVSVFLPFTKEVKASNAHDMRMPSIEWLLGRIEGQTMINSLSKFLQDKLRGMGFRCVAPSVDSRFRAFSGGSSNESYGSNWSERHVAYAAGMGTFGLSRGIITKKGIAGRFTSVITDIEHTATKREYRGIYDYCTMCGACLRNCPAGAITVRGGKEHAPCSAFLDNVKEICSPRYGCGKCQVGVPCENGIPRA